MWQVIIFVAIKAAENSVRLVSGEVEISLTSAPMTCESLALNNSCIILFGIDKMQLIN